MSLKAPADETERPPLLPVVGQSPVFDGDVPLNFVIECLNENTATPDVRSATDFLTRNGLGVQLFYILPLPNVMFYMVADAHKNYQGLLTDTDVERKVQICWDNKMGMAHFSRKDSNPTDHRVVKTLVGGTDDYKVYFDDCRTDIVKVATLLLQYTEKRPDLVCHDDGENIRMNLGYYYCDNEEPETKPSLVTMKPELEFFYEAAGPVLQCMQRAADELYWKENYVYHMSDTIRYYKFAKEMEELCKCQGIRFEAFTWAIAILGKVGDDFTDPNWKTKIVCRHCDEHCDYRPGYNQTATWSCVLVIEGEVIRLTLTAYTRVGIGDFLEYKYAKDAMSE